MPKLKTLPEDDNEGWVPVRKGLQYCSPRCGHGCTHEEFKAAEKAAAALAKRLGPDWTPRVWENIGWHYAAECGTASMHPHKRNGVHSHYTFMMSPGPGTAQIVTSGKDPIRLISQALTELYEAAALLERSRAALARGSSM